MIHDSVDSEASRLVRMVGNATLTIVVSSRAMNMPASRTISACQLRRGTSADGGPLAGAVAARRGVVWSVMERVLGMRRGGGQGVGRQRPGAFVGDDGGHGGEQVDVPVDLGAQPVLAVLQGVGLGEREVRAGQVVGVLDLD